LKLNDTLLGVIFAAFGGIIIFLSRDLPDIASYQYGPGFFPSLIGGLLVAAGIILALQGLRTVGHARMVEFADWTRSRRHVVDALLVIAAVVAYNLVVDTLGFLITAFLLLFLVVWRLWRRPLPALVVAVAATIVTHQAFGEFLLVPLPWGVLEPLSGALTWR
jgi:putative tricarboxylic transport membrane protein